MTANMTAAQNIENFDALQQDFDGNVVMAAFKSGTKSLGATARDHVAIPLDKIRFRENYNPRLMTPQYKARIEHIAALMLANGYQQDKPITGFVTKQGDEIIAYVVAGHTRVLAARLANSKGANIVSVPMLKVPEGTDETDLNFDLVLSNDGAPLSLYEQGIVNHRHINSGLSIAEIARRTNVSDSHVRNSLELRSAPRAVVEMIVEGKISETLALNMLRQHGSDAISVLQKGVETAQSLGKKKVTVATLQGPKMPAPVAMSAVGAVETFVKNLDVGVVQSVKALAEDAQAEEVDENATIPVPLSMLRKLIEMSDEISSAREKMAEKEAKAKERQEKKAAEQAKGDRDERQQDLLPTDGVEGGDSAPESEDASSQEPVDQDNA